MNKVVRDLYLRFLNGTNVVISVNFDLKRGIPDSQWYHITLYLINVKILLILNQAKPFRGTAINLTL